MNKCKMLKCLSLIITVALIFSSFTFFAFASESFSDVVGGIDETEDYMTRYERVERAFALYSELSDEEKALVSDLFATLLDEESSLLLLKNRADSFIAHVNSFSELSDLDEKLSAVLTARREDVLFTDASYPGISEALLELEEFEETVLETVDVCLSFIDAVDLVLSIDEADYIELSEALAEASLYVDRVDKTFDGIDGAYQSYVSIKSALREKELYTEEFLSAVADLKEITDYKSFSKAYNNVLDYTKSENFIPDYKGVSEALKYLEDAEGAMKDAVKRANAFVSYVNTLGASGNLALDLINAFTYLEGVDLTVDGVSSAVSMLDSAIAEYNARAKRANADFSYV